MAHLAALAGCATGAWAWKGWGGVALVGTGVGLGLLLASARSTQTRRRFDGGYEELDHTLLNASADTQWMNMGLWEPQGTAPHTPQRQHYATACRSLATRLAKACSLSPEDDVLDVGFGRGEQCAHWFDTFGIRSLFGINISADEVAAATARMQAAGHTEAQLVQGSACDLRGAVQQRTFTKVLSLDSAYHYAPSRADFLEESFAVLRGGGSLAAADIVAVQPTASWAPVAQLLLRALCWASSLPQQNLVTREEYEKQLLALGYRGVRSESIGGEVFPGFAAFLRRQREELEGITPSHLWWRYSCFASLADYVYYNGVLDYVVFTAEKPA